MTGSPKIPAEPSHEAIGAAIAQLPVVLADLAALPQQIEEIRNDAARRADAEALIAAIDKGLHPDHAYLPKHAAVLLGVSRKTLYSGPYRTLPRGTSGSILGIWIMAAQGVVSYDEAKAYVEARRSAVLALTKKAEEAATGER